MFGNSALFLRFLGSQFYKHFVFPRSSGVCWPPKLVPSGQPMVELVFLENDCSLHVNLIQNDCNFPQIEAAAWEDFQVIETLLRFFVVIMRKAWSPFAPSVWLVSWSQNFSRMLWSKKDTADPLSKMHIRSAFCYCSVLKRELSVENLYIRYFNILLLRLNWLRDWPCPFVYLSVAAGCVFCCIRFCRTRWPCSIYLIACLFL